MPDTTTRSAVKRARTAIAAAAKMMLWRLHQQDATARNFAGSGAVQRGYPTIITLGSSCTYAAGSKVTVSGIVGPTELNTTHLVLWSAGTKVALDVDSSALADWVSGGTITPTIAADELGLMPVMPLQGTVTGVYANPTHGLTAHSSGTNSLLQSSGLSAIDLSAHAGCVAISAEVYFTANPSAKEYLFSLGVETATGSNTAAGCLTLYLSTSGSLSLVVRPRGATDSVCSNTFGDAGAMSTATRKQIGFVLDMSGASWTAYLLIDGVYTKSFGVTMTGAAGGIGNGAGFALGASISTSLTLGGKLGDNGSGARVRDLMIWPTTKTAAQTMRALSRFQQSKILPHEMV